MEQGRKYCPSCGQQLAHAAYYRHIHDETGSVCPGKLGSADGGAHTSREEAEDDFVESLPSSSDYDEADCSFDFGSAMAESNSDVDEARSNEGDGGIADFGDEDLECSSSSGMSSSDDLESAEEIWETSDEDDVMEDDVSRGEEHQAKEVLFGISTFLNFFQLTYHISERAMVTLLVFLRTLLLHLSTFSQGNSVLKTLAQLIPKSLYSIRKIIRKSHDGITEYVVCPKCHHLYKMDQCIIKVNGREESKRCNFVNFPNHPQCSRRSKCNTPLMKWVCVGGKSKLIPRKTFLYHSIISALEKLVAVKGFLQKCEHWRNRSSVPDGTYTDVYDGKVWKDLQYINGSPFLALPGSLCLSLNIDWFQPYDETQYSVGAIYLVVQNLPRSERFKFDNVILVGLMPGPTEPSKTVNTYLQLLVTDLVKLYHGVTISNSHSIFGSSSIRAILSCIVCDLPATRKVCGFMGVNAKKGCSKCLKEFVTGSFGEKPDYSGYDTENWEPRDMKTHIVKTLKAKSAETATRQAEVEKSYGARYSVLLQLSYMDIIRYHVIDPMHNLFLGIAKHTTNTWKELHILKSGDFVELQKKVDSITPPPKIGRIPRKIGSGFSSFTADEWKNWILMYSVYCLKDVLPTSDYQCWCLFVDACSIICHLVITDSEVSTAHGLLVQFCKCFQELYGHQRCTPNMHMVCHLHKNIRDYGPLTAFWAFSFERYNGALENTRISWCGPEKQMFKKFIDLQSLHTVEAGVSNGEFIKSMHTAIRSMQPSNNFSSVDQMTADTSFLFRQSRYYSCPVKFIDATEKSCYELLPPLTEKCLHDIEMEYISAVYKILYPEHQIIHISRFYRESKRLMVNGEEFITTKARSQRSSTFLAYWPGVISIDSLGEAPVRVGVFYSFLSHKVVLRLNTSDTNITAVHTLCRVRWFEDHPRRDYIHPSIIVSATTYDMDGPTSFMPVSRIIARCATVHDCLYKFDYGEDKVCLSIPLVKSQYQS